MMANRPRWEILVLFCRVSLVVFSNRVVIKALLVLATLRLRLAAINPALGQREAPRFRFFSLFERGF